MESKRSEGISTSRNGDTQCSNWRHYRAAVAEFDHLWETGLSKRQPEKMRQLLRAIESFEEARLSNL